MIAPTLISNFDEIIKKMIFKSEGDNIEQPLNVGDHTVTYGYGYTFIRKNNSTKGDVVDQGELLFSPLGDPLYYLRNS